jgi:hypothetical protein
MTSSSSSHEDLLEAVRAACHAEPDNPALIFEDGVSLAGPGYGRRPNRSPVTCNSASSLASGSRS